MLRGAARPRKLPETGLLEPQWVGVWEILSLVNFHPRVGRARPQRQLVEIEGPITADKGLVTPALADRAQSVGARRHERDPANGKNPVDILLDHVSLRGDTRVSAPSLGGRGRPPARH